MEALVAGHAVAIDVRRRSGIALILFITAPARSRTNSFRPKAGGRFIIGDGTSFVLFITLPFRVGAR